MIKITKGTTTNINLSGQLDDELSVDEQDKARVALQDVPEARAMRIDVTALASFDSWGEGLVQDLAEDKVLSVGGKVAFVEDIARPHLLLGLKDRLKEYLNKDAVQFFTNTQKANKWLRGS